MTFNLSEKMWGPNGDACSKKDIAKFIKLLKEEIEMYDFQIDILDRLAGEKFR